MGVVQLRRPAVREALQRLSSRQLQANHVLQGTGDEKVLLLQPELLARLGLVVRIEDLGDGLGRDLLLDGAVVIADIEGIEVERFGRFRLPEAKYVRRLRAIAGNR